MRAWSAYARPCFLLEENMYHIGMYDTYTRTFSRYARTSMRVVVFMLTLALVYGDIAPLGLHTPQVPRAHASAQPVVIVISDTASTTWTVPSNWNSASNTIEVIGGGGGGATGANGGTNGGPGSRGGGGAYSRLSNVTLTSSTDVAIQVGGGGGVATAGGDTFICNSTSNCASISGTRVVVGAKGGTGGSGQSTGGVGGASASGVASSTLLT